jgi:hypothetical protein
MTTETQDLTTEKINQLRELFADAPEVGKKALENVLGQLKSQTSQKPPPVQSAGRTGARLGKVSELTIIVPFAPGGAQRLRAFLQLFGGNLAGADDVGTVHDMRFVFLDNDTRMLFATAFRRHETPGPAPCLEVTPASADSLSPHSGRLHGRSLCCVHLPPHSRGFGSTVTGGGLRECNPREA